MNRQRMKKSMEDAYQRDMAALESIHYGYYPMQHMAGTIAKPEGPFGSVNVDIPVDAPLPPPPCGAGKGFTGI